VVLALALLAGQRATSAARYALVALNTPLRGAGVVALAVAAGLLHGLVNGATMAPGGASALALAGAITAVFCLTAILAAEVITLSAGWTRIAVRVAGSWIAAAGLLMLGWLAR
jgi:hydrogenase/urease accessory protein HupE